MSSEVIDVFWFGGRDTIGIVSTKDDITSKMRYFIGVGKGIDVDQDIQYIKNWGTCLEPYHIKGMLDIDKTVSEERANSLISKIDDILMYLEDHLHGDDSNHITVARALLNTLPKYF